MPENEASSLERVTVARVLRPHGRRGEVAAEILTDFPDHLKRLKTAILWDGKAEPRSVAVRSCWLSQSRGGQAIIHFEGSDSISDAETLVGLEVQIPLGERVPLPIGSYYVTDLIGCDVRDTASNIIGRVRDVQFTGENLAGTPLLVIEAPQGELLVPLAADICVTIDVSVHQIVVNLPEGLRDLNR